MSDSPVGIAASNLEKFGAWADVPHDERGTRDLWKGFDEGTRLINITLYVAPKSLRGRSPLRRDLHTLSGRSTTVALCGGAWRR